MFKTVFWPMQCIVKKLLKIYFFHALYIGNIPLKITHNEKLALCPDHAFSMNI